MKISNGGIKRTSLIRPYFVITVSSPYLYPHVYAHKATLSSGSHDQFSI